MRQLFTPDPTYRFKAFSRPYKVSYHPHKRCALYLLVLSVVSNMRFCTFCTLLINIFNCCENHRTSSAFLLKSIPHKKCLQRFMRSWKAEQSLKDAKPEAELLDEIQTKVVGVFLLVTLRFIFLHTHATSCASPQTHSTSYIFLQ